MNTNRIPMADVTAGMKILIPGTTLQRVVLAVEAGSIVTKTHTFPIPTTWVGFITVVSA